MQTFAYQTPTSVADAVRLAKGADAKIIAGGQSLLGSMKLGLIEPDSLVDLGQIAELKGIKRDGAALVIGAMTTHAEVAASKEVQQALPALAALADGIGVPVTVEGIEDAATHAAVAGFGCAVGQGWYFGKPMSGDQATALLRSRKNVSEAAAPAYRNAAS